MTAEKFKRKLTAILSADVKGYSRLMGADEEATLRTLQEYKEVMASSMQHHRGRIVGTAGDSVLAEFASVVDAMQCSVEIQQVLRAKNALVPETRRMDFRIGINLGDVIEEGDTIYGDGVNIAARVEGLAEAGGICISESAYQQIENKLPLRYDYVGEHEVKNIAKPVRVYRARIESEAAPSKLNEEKKPAHKRLSNAVLAIIAVVVIAGAVILYQFVLRPSASKTAVASKDKMALPLPDRPSIAVLPFANMSDDLKQEYFSDGMTEDLITDLSKISGLFVIARNSTFVYKGKPVKVKQVAEELGVRYVLEGSVRRAGDQVRINAQLIDALTGHHLWADRYDGKMENVFALQDRITQKIVAALAVKLTGSEKEQMPQKGTDNMAAYDEYLKGWGHYFRLTPDDFAKANASLRKAIELDPDFGRAHAALALLHWTATQHPALLPGLGMGWWEARLRAREFLQKAMKKPTSIAYNISSQLYLYHGQHEKAISEMERALTLDPNDPSCHQTMGFILSMAGRPKQAMEFIKSGMRLDPHNPSRYLWLLGWAHFCVGELEEAARLVEKALRLNPENIGIKVQLAVCYALLGRDQEAREALDTWRRKPEGAGRLDGYMFFYRFKDRAVADRYAQGLLKAGLPPGKTAGGYFPAFKENQLTGEEIKGLLFGSKITGINIYDGQQWWHDRKKNGEFTWRGSGPIPSDTGWSRIEGDMFCFQFQKRAWGLETCGTAFRNPKGTHENRDEYFLCLDSGFSPFSLVK